jgi:uncharacterized damage-inducible protein DinB
MTDEEQRIRSYLTAQGAKLSPPAIIEKVRAAMDELAAAARAIPPARFAERPAADEWSGNEVLAHVVDAGTYFGDGILGILDGRPPPARPAGRDDERPPVRSADAWLERLERDRGELFERVLAADPDPRPGQTLTHPAFGPLEWRPALLFLRLHDLDHAGQLQKVAAALAAPRG